jgi:hypothetical protein
MGLKNNLKLGGVPHCKIRKQKKTEKNDNVSGPVHPQIQAGWNLGATEPPLWIGMLINMAMAMVNTKNDQNG